MTGAPERLNKTLTTTERERKSTLAALVLSQTPMTLSEPRAFTWETSGTTYRTSSLSSLKQRDNQSSANTGKGLQVEPPFKKRWQTHAVFCLFCTFSTCIRPRCGFLMRGGAPSRRHASDAQVKPSHVHLPQQRRRELKPVHKALFTLQCLVLWVAKEVAMPAVAMDTCLHWNSWKWHKLSK